VFGYTAQFGNGFSASLSAEDETSRRSAITSTAGLGAWTYEGRRFPDVVANLRIDQAWGSAQVMGALHDVAGVNTVAGTTDTSVGYALGAGLKFNLPMIGKGDYVIAQVEYADGAMNYIGSNFAAGGSAMALSTGYPAITNTALGYVADAVATSATSLDKTKGWSITGGFEHIWSPMWKTSLYGSYGKMTYSAAASATIAAIVAGGAAGSADWSLWQVGSRTVWTPVQNLDLSLEVLYTDLNKSSFDGAGIYGSKGYVSGIFRVQRNFWP
jgi:hypothetical protein